MKAILSLSVAICALLACTPGSPNKDDQAVTVPTNRASETSASPNGTQENQKPGVQATLHAAWAQMSPDSPPYLVAQLEAIPGWHIYWAHPGEAGLPTRFRLKRQGNAFGHQTHMPLPHRMTSPGDIVSYGYEGRTHFFIDSAEAAQGGAFSLRADWLACKEVCVKGNAVTELPQRPKTAPAPSAEARKDWRKVPKSQNVEWRRAGPAWVLDLEQSSQVELYPHGALQLALDQTRPPYCKGNRCRLKLPPSALQEHASLAYTLRISNGDAIQGIEADFMKGIKP